VRWHLNYPDITAHAGRVGARRLILTHMSREMLARAADVPEQCAYDGLVLTL
jgi:phosphoribosyl 1,2-cyclic phosphodiesterase